DIVKWDEDPATFIANALNPADVLAVRFDPENEHDCTVVVPDDQLSLAIGKRGQNVRLAARLTGYKIDIKSETDAAVEDKMVAEPVEPAVEEEPVEDVSVETEATDEGSEE